MKRLFLLLLSLGLFGAGQAQIESAELTASGLTCSLCSRAIAEELKELPFIEKVTVNLAASGFNLAFKQGQEVDLDAIAQAVEDAGFAVSELYITAQVAERPVTVRNNTHVPFGTGQLHFMEVEQTSLEGTVRLRLLDEQFVPKKEFKQRQKETNYECYTTGHMGQGMQRHRVYHVTLASR